MVKTGRRLLRLVETSALQGGEAVPFAKFFFFF